MWCFDLGNSRSESCPWISYQLRLRSFSKGVYCHRGSEGPVVHFFPLERYRPPALLEREGAKEVTIIIDFQEKSPTPVWLSMQGIRIILNSSQ